MHGLECGDGICYSGCLLVRQVTQTVSGCVERFLKWTRVVEGCVALWRLTDPLAVNACRWAIASDGVVVGCIGALGMVVFGMMVATAE